MGGLEKILEHIIKKANDEADLILEDAREKEEIIKTETNKEIEEIIKKNQIAIKNECDKIISMSESQDRQNAKREILKAKSDVIKVIIEESKKAIKDMQAEDYKEMLIKILKNSMSDEDGEIIFSKNDKKLLDSDFIEKLNDVTKGRLKIPDETGDIENGFIIRYGKIEYNCSIDSIFEEKKNELVDLVNSFLMTD